MFLLSRDSLNASMGISPNLASNSFHLARAPDAVHSTSNSVNTITVGITRCNNAIANRGLAIRAELSNRRQVGTQGRRRRNYNRARKRGGATAFVSVNYYQPRGQ